MSNPKLSVVIAILVTAISFVSCSKDNNEPIQLHYAIYDDKPNTVIGNQVAILFPISNKTQLEVSGDDGNFAINLSFG